MKGLKRQCVQYISALAESGSSLKIYSMHSHLLSTRCSLPECPTLHLHWWVVLTGLYPRFGRCHWLRLPQPSFLGFIVWKPIPIHLTFVVCRTREFMPASFYFLDLLFVNLLDFLPRSLQIFEALQLWTAIQHVAC